MCMTNTCIAYLDDGRLCGRPASHLDPQRGGLVCTAHFPFEINPIDSMEARIDKPERQAGGGAAMIHEISLHPLDTRDHCCDNCQAKLYRFSYAYRVDGFKWSLLCYACAEERRRRTRSACHDAPAPAQEGT